MERDDVFAHVLDGLDIETYFICRNEKEGRALAFALMTELGFQHGDVIMTEPVGGGVRVRMRAVIHAPNDRPGWLEKGQKEVDRGNEKKR